MASGDESDDLTIGNDEKLWRLVLPKHTSINQSTEEISPWDGNFRDVRGPLSIDISSLTTLQEAFQRGSNEKWIAEFTAGTARNAGCRIIKDPTPENKAHGLIFGAHKNGGPTGSEAKKIARESKIISSPTS